MSLPNHLIFQVLSIVTIFRNTFDELNDRKLQIVSSMNEYHIIDYSRIAWQRMNILYLL